MQATEIPPFALLSRARDGKKPCAVRLGAFGDFAGFTAVFDGGQVDLFLGASGDPITVDLTLAAVLMRNAPLAGFGRPICPSRADPACNHETSILSGICEGSLCLLWEIDPPTWRIGSSVPPLDIGAFRFVATASSDGLAECRTGVIDAERTVTKC